MTTAVGLPMFPLGTAHLPGDVVALRVFEPRYVAMVKDLLAAERMQFGSVLITAGSEVGGGERRAGHGVLVEVRDCVVTAEGGYGLMGAATDVIAVVEWLPDSPYPRAVVETTRAETTETITGSVVDEHRASLSRLAQNIRTLHERAAEATASDGGGPLPPREVMFALRTIASGLGPESPEAERAQSTVRPETLARLESTLWLLARAVPCGPLDRLTLLATTGVGPRIRALEAVVDHVSEVLDFGR